VPHPDWPEIEGEDTVRKISLALGLAILFALSASAQTTSSSKIDTSDHGSGEAYLGWTHVTGDVGKNGWNISGAKNIGTHFAAEADIFGAYGDTTILTIEAKQHEYGFLGGGKVMFDTRHTRFTPWVHLLLGVGHTGLDTNVPGADNSDTSFAWALGGGVDYAITQNVSARGKIDLYHTSYFGDGDTHARWGLGVLYTFGR
jgi:opacity protein-like surface antigen